MSKNPNIPGVDADALVREATGLMPSLTRRRFLSGAGSLGSLVLLTGCQVEDGKSAETLLERISAFNDDAQAALFRSSSMARTFSQADITRPFPFNAYYGAEDAPDVDAADWRLEIGGLVQDKSPWSLQRLATLNPQTQITELICVEGWSAIGKWRGPRLWELLQVIGADLTANYVGFRCEDRYSTSIDMATALHSQTQITLEFNDRPLPRIYGFPMRVRIPTKLGFKNPKHVYELFVTNDYPGGYWENQGYNWFSGL